MFVGHRRGRFGDQQVNHRRAREAEDYVLDSWLRYLHRPSSSAARGRGGGSVPIAAEGIMATGKVKWFNDSKGFGFIVRAEGPDLFVHHTAIVAEGFRSLAEGQDVEFEVTEVPKGLQATNVRPVR